MAEQTDSFPHLTVPDDAPPGSMNELIALVTRLTEQQRGTTRELNKLNRNLFGNGQPGMLEKFESRLVKTERGLDQQQNRWSTCPARAQTEIAAKALAQETRNNRIHTWVALVMLTVTTLSAMGMFGVSLYRTYLQHRTMENSTNNAAETYTGR